MPEREEKRCEEEAKKALSRVFHLEFIWDNMHCCPAAENIMG